MARKMRLEDERADFVRGRWGHRMMLWVGDAWLWWSYATGGADLVLALAVIVLLVNVALEVVWWAGARHYDRRIEAHRRGSSDL